MKNRNIHNQTIIKIQQEYIKSKNPWTLAFSGGKDSTALLKIVYLALKYLSKKDKPITIVYCDSGVEIPILKNSVNSFLINIKKEVIKDKIPFHVVTTKPKIEDSFFVNLIGKGYPPPTNKFKWCTRRLKTNPIKSVFADKNKKNILLLGSRINESSERKNTLMKYRILSENYFYQSTSKKTIIYCPILNYSVEDIWDLLLNIKYPKSIELLNLSKFYNITKNNNNEFYKNNGIRFGCWICTVIRKDKALEDLIKRGYSKLEYLLNFKKWLLEIRDLPENRIIKDYRKNTLGSFKLKTRKMILNELLKTQERVHWKLITVEELNTINMIWKEYERLKYF